MIELPHLMKAASNRGDNARLVCRASAAPKPNFKWSRDGVIIPSNGTQKKYSVQITQVKIYSDKVTVEKVNVPTRWGISF